MTLNSHNIAAQCDTRSQPVRGYNRLALWLVLLAMLPLTLLIVGVQVTREATVESADVNHSGSLRFRSLLLYGLTHQNSPNAEWSPVLAEMGAIREDLRIRYPQAVGQTDIPWNTFSESLQRSGQVDWQVALRMRNAADQLTQSIEDSAKSNHNHANILFLAGIVATALFALLALIGVRINRRVEQTQAQVEERFRVLFEHSSDAHLLFDATGIIDCNQATIQMLHCHDKAEVLALHPAVLSPEFQTDGRRSLEKCLEMDSLARQQGYHRFEWLHRTMDGTEFPVEVTLTPVLLGGKDAMLVVWYDLTERKEGEEAVRKSEERLLEAQHIAHIGSWERDLVTGNILWSDQMFRLYRLAPAGGVPNIEQIMSCIHPEDRTAYQHVVEMANESGQSYEFDLRLLFEDGGLTWGHMVGHVEHDATGKAVRRFGTLMDITAQKQTEEAIRKSQESLNNAQALAHVGSWERDYRAGTIFWSDELFRLCGLEPGSITPSIEALFHYTHPLDRKRAEECMQQAIQSGRGGEIEVRFVGADGVLRNISIRTEILKDKTGQSIGSRGTLTDITERVKALQEQTKFVSLIENSSDFIAIASLDGMLLTMNPAGRKLVGLERVEEITSTMLPDIIPAEVWDRMRQDVLPIVMRDDRWEGECQLANITTGKVCEMQASLFLIRNPISGEPMCLATVQRDITGQKWLDTQLQLNILLVQEQNVELEWHQQELASANRRLEAANRMLETLATSDGLTGAKNHRALQEKLGEEIKRAQRTFQPLSVIMLDIDKFKTYNDTFGHPEGDRVLQQVVRTLQETARESDFIARYGGEEFILLLPDTNVAGALGAAERFRVAIETQNWPMRRITASFGIATLNSRVTTAQQLVEMADKALYISKEEGRNRVTHTDAIYVP